MVARRTVREARLLSVDPVVHPAYGQKGSTSIQARARQLWPEGLPVEVRSRFPKLEEQLKLATLLSPVSADERRRQAAIRQRGFVV